MNKDRTIYYHRANFFTTNAKASLCTLLKAAYKRRDRTSRRTFDYKIEEVQGTQFENKGERLFIQMTQCSPNTPISMVPKPGEATKSGTTEEPPPSDADFMGGDVFALIQGNHVLSCMSGCRLPALSHFFVKMIDKAGASDPADQFSLTRVANIDKVKLLQREGGARKVHLGVSATKATMEYEAEKERKKQKFHRKVASFVSREALSLFKKHEKLSADELRDLDNLMVDITISWDRRRKGKLAQIPMNKIAESLVGDKDVDRFKIETADGTRMGPDDICLKKPVRVNAHGSSVSRSGVWEELDQYMDELADSGMLNL